MTARSALSRAASTDDAVREVLASIDVPGADLVAVFATPHHHDALVGVGAAVAEHVGDAAVFGGVASGVVGGAVEVEDGPGLAILAAATGVSPRPFHAQVGRDGDGRVGIAGWPRADADDLVVVAADARRFPAPGVLAHLAEANDGDSPAVAGGLLDAGGLVDGPTLLGEGGTAYLGGATGVVLPGMAGATRTSQGCLPLGDPMTVTGAEGNQLLGVAGRPPAEVLAELFAQADEADRERLRRGLQLGIALPDARGEYGVGDFLVRGILGSDPQRGSLTVGAALEVGQVVQLHTRDAATATADLEKRLDDVAGGAGLLFTCNGRGSNLFTEPDHDATRLADRVGRAVAGAFCAGEIGTVGGVAHLHGFTATLVALPSTDEDMESAA